MQIKDGRLHLRLRHPNRVCAVIPDARLHNQHDVIVPFKPDEVQLLRNLGINAPSPILTEYKWAGQYEPFEAQRETARFLTDNRRGFVLNDLGTGKTLSTLWAFDYLRKVGQARKMLVISPLSTLERAWGDEVFRHFTHLQTVVLHGTKDKRLKRLKMAGDIFLINHDGIVTILDEIIAADFDVVCIDEIATFRNAQTRRWKALRKVIADRPRVWGLTGTPTPNEPTDAYGQCKLICPDNIPKFYTQFRDKCMRKVSAFKWAAKNNATDYVASVMQPAIRYSRDECVDLPPCMYSLREVPLTTEQAKVYKDMTNKLVAEYEDGTIRALNAAIKMNKLLQIAAGVVYDEEGEEIVLPSKPRIDELKDVVQQSTGKVICFVAYRSILDYVKREMETDIDTFVVHGGISKTARDKIFQEFQSSKKKQLLLAQPASMSHGLTLTAANTICWYGPITSQETYSQANARITRPGQKLQQYIVHIASTPAERGVYDRLKNKAAMETLLLDLIKKGQI